MTLARGSLTMTFELFLWASILLPALAALAWIDGRTFRLPDTLTLPLIGVGLVQYWYFSGQVLDGLIGAGVGYLFFLSVEKGFRAIRGIEGLGRGDAKLLAAGGAWCGWMGLPWIVLVASGTGLVFAGLMTLVGKRPNGMIAFGPFLALGIAAVWLKPLLTDVF
jgi:prepilin signal peptidase PulO-like enzyme (type II secretory pathway)